MVQLSCSGNRESSPEVHLQKPGEPLGQTIMRGSVRESHAQQWLLVQCKNQ